MFKRSYRKVSRTPIKVRFPDGSSIDPQKNDYTDEPLDSRQSKRKGPKFTNNVASANEPFIEKVNFSHLEDKKPVLAGDLLPEVQFKDFLKAQKDVRSLLSQTKSRKTREKHGVFLVEGLRLVREALYTGITPQAIFFSQTKLLPKLTQADPRVGLEELKFLNELPLYKTPYKTLQMWSSLTTCPGLMGVFEIPDPSNLPQGTLPVKLILDEVGDPGNLGSILRTAAAVGVSQIFLTKGCCDMWEPKVIRSASGAHFRIPAVSKVSWDSISNFVPESQMVFLADIARMENDDESARVVNDDVSSLTMAPTTFEHLDDEIPIYDLDSQGQKRFVHDYNDETVLDRYRNVQFPMLSYNNIKVLPKSKYVDESIVLIIGGETGLSNAAKRFTAINGGSQIAVPLANGIESLNASVAAGIILYELQRQYHLLDQQEKRSFQL